MRKYNRNKELTKASGEAQYSYDYDYYALWYDDCWDTYYCDDDDCPCDKSHRDDCGGSGMDWYYDNREMLERNQTINEVLGINDGDGVPFNALNF